MGRKITAMQVQKRNNQRVNIYIDGEYAFGLARILAAWLQVGQELSEEKIAQLQADDEHEASFQKALKFLNYRDRSEAELSAYLEQHGVSEELVSETISRLRQNGIINDQRFAARWVENRVEFRPRGRRALAYELRHKGVNQITIDRALENVNEDELAYQTANKYQKKLTGLDWLDFRKKLYAHLARRGFSSETITSTVRRVWDERQEHAMTEYHTHLEEVDE
jgi:regulatory protein